MARIAEQAENDMMRVSTFAREMVWHEMDALDVTNAIAHAASTLAQDIKAGAIMAVTKTGYTAGRMAKFRPDTLIIGASPYEKTYHQMSLLWGVYPIRSDYRREIEDCMENYASKAIAAGIIKEGDKLVVTAGLPVDEKGNTNLIRVITAERS